MHDLTFGGGAMVRKEKESKDPGKAKKTGGMSINAER